VTYKPFVEPDIRLRDSGEVIRGATRAPPAPSVRDMYKYDGVMRKGWHGCTANSRSPQCSCPHRRDLLLREIDAMLKWAQ